MHLRLIQLVCLLAFIFGCGQAYAQNSAITGYCTQGATTAVTSGLNSTNTLQGIVPSCLVSVYLTGTTTPATIYSNANAGVLNNPFTASNLGQYTFYSANSGCYDITLSGGQYNNSFKSPVTLTGVCSIGANGIYSVSTFSGLQSAITLCSTASICSISIGSFIAVTASTVIPSSVQLSFQSGQLQPAAGTTLTILGTINAGPTQIFGGAGTITGLPTVLPEWFGNTGTCWVGGAATPCPVISTAAASLGGGGGTVKLQSAYYRSGTESGALAIANLTVIGTRKPTIDSATLPTTLVNGSVIQGGFGNSANGWKLYDLGCDTGPAFINGLDGGVAENGCVIGNPGQTIGLPQWAGFVASNLISLGYAPTAPFHAFLFENLTGASISNVTAYNSGHCLAFKGTYSTINGVTSRGCQLDTFLSKSDAYAPSHDDNFSNINVGSLRTDGVIDSSGIGIQGIGSNSYNINLNGATINNVSQAITLATSGASTQANVNISNVTASNAGVTRPSTGYGCLYFTDTISSSPTSIFGTRFSNVSCDYFNSDLSMSNVVALGTQVNNFRFTNTQGNSVSTDGDVALNNGIIQGATNNGVVPFAGVVTISNVPVSVVGAPFVTTNGGVIVNSATTPTVMLSTTTTPAFTATDARQYMQLTANVTSFSIANGVRDGDPVDLLLCQDNTGGRTLSGIPSNVIGLNPIPSGQAAGTCNNARLIWSALLSKWIKSGMNWGDLS